GTYWMNHITRRLNSGQPNPEDVELLVDVAREIQGKCLCALGEFSTMAVLSGIEKFRSDFNGS
ncbi:MAG TPA: NADH-ubiquinone oxidoreductase-F iron-sulfur binding region domain-containing protein, partial [Anaerolineaceae bacterium]|nr:NADH-ubiquinone oxidoreductase-F iron-sulfur binding region domain-containing protein [Anaerolineaceae bacterium]